MGKTQLCSSILSITKNKRTEDVIADIAAGVEEDLLQPMAKARTQSGGLCVRLKTR
jgi:hypothetical protein